MRRYLIPMVLIAGLATDAQAMWLPWAIPFNPFGLIQPATPQPAPGTGLQSTSATIGINNGITVNGPNHGPTPNPGLGVRPGGPFVPISSVVGVQLGATPTGTPVSGTGNGPSTSIPSPIAANLTPSAPAPRMPGTGLHTNSFAAPMSNGMTTTSIVWGSNGSHNCTNSTGIYGGMNCH